MPKQDEHSRDAGYALARYLTNRFKNRKKRKQFKKDTKAEAKQIFDKLNKDDGYAKTKLSWFDLTDNPMRTARDKAFGDVLKQVRKTRENNPRRTYSRKMIKRYAKTTKPYGRKMIKKYGYKKRPIDK